MNIGCLSIFRVYNLFRNVKDLTFYSRDTCSAIFIAAQFIIAKEWKEPKCPSTVEWTVKI